jgi:hypothetical protein
LFNEVHPRTILTYPLFYTIENLYAVWFEGYTPKAEMQDYLLFDAHGESPHANSIV